MSPEEWGTASVHQSLQVSWRNCALIPSLVSITALRHGVCGNTHLTYWKVVPRAVKQHAEIT